MIAILAKAMVVIILQYMIISTLCSLNVHYVIYQLYHNKIHILKKDNLIMLKIVWNVQL